MRHLPLLLLFFLPACQAIRDVAKEQAEQAVTEWLNEKGIVYVPETMMKFDTDKSGTVTPEEVMAGGGVLTLLLTGLMEMLRRRAMNRDNEQGEQIASLKAEVNELWDKTHKPAVPQ